MLFEPYVVFIFLVLFGWPSGRLLGNSCSLGLRLVFMVRVPKCHFSFFPPLGLWSGNYFLIAPFPDHCLFVLFQNEYLSKIDKPYVIGAIKKSLAFMFSG